MAAKTTVSIPDDMHEWARNQPDLNVSELVRTALLREKAARDRMAGDDLAGALANRLRAAGGKNVEDQHPELYQAGRRFAAQSLSIGELGDITAWHRDTFFTGVDGWSLLGRLADLTDTFREDPRGLYAQCFEDIIGPKRLSGARVEAFTKGIVDLWEEAEAQLEEEPGADHNSSGSR